MHDAADTIIYVGKAVNLKNRVRQYFQTRVRSPKIERMISLIDHFEYIVVESEMEALVLECNLIKENRPKYNTMLMDDKSYPFVKVTVNEKFPRVMLVHNRKRDKARYFGPYTSVFAVKETLELLRKIYMPRTCSKRLDGTPNERPCLYYHMKQCKAPCTGKVSEEDYRRAIDSIIAFLDGDVSSIKRDIKAKMERASFAMEFEQAAEYRDMLRNIEKMSQTQKVTSGDEGNRDVIGLATADDEAVVQVFFIRNGKMVGREHFYLTGVRHETRNGVMTDFVKQYYAAAPGIPRELLLSDAIEDEELIAGWLSDKLGLKVSIRVPQRGDKEGLVKLACNNASMVLQRDAEKLLHEEARTTGALKELAQLLDIEYPARIEAYDISNISGFESVGSMVVYENGKPKRSDYRKFRIRTVTGSDDYASMREVLTRRFEHGMREAKELLEKNISEDIGSFTKMPDLVLMDGGRGQVNIALEVFERLGIDISVCGMVKDDNHRTRGIYYNNTEVPIDTHSELFKLITRIQDETHRFAIEYHRMLRSKTQVKSILDDIEGIGKVRRRALMKHFESLEAVKAADIEELSRVDGMNMAAAEKVYNFFRAGAANAGEGQKEG